MPSYTFDEGSMTYNVTDPNLVELLNAAAFAFTDDGFPPGLAFNDDETAGLGMDDPLTYFICSQIITAFGDSVSNQQTRTQAMERVYEVLRDARGMIYDVTAGLAKVDAYWLSVEAKKEGK